MSNGRASNLVSGEPLSSREGVIEDSEEGLGRRGDDEGSFSCSSPSHSPAQPPRSRSDSTTTIAWNDKYHLLKLHERGQPATGSVPSRGPAEMSMVTDPFLPTRRHVQAYTPGRKSQHRTQGTGSLCRAMCLSHRCPHLSRQPTGQLEHCQIK